MCRKEKQMVRDLQKYLLDLSKQIDTIEDKTHKPYWSELCDHTIENLIKLQKILRIK